MNIIRSQCQDIMAADKVMWCGLDKFLVATPINNFLSPVQKFNGMMWSGTSGGFLNTML